MWDVSLGVDDRSLSHWRGMPKWERDVGGVMQHMTRRGPRWTHRHALGGLALLIPDKAGFRPLVRGEFDLSYTLLAENAYGRGAAYFCSFDFEGRVGTCPAATEVARRAFARFLAPPAEEGRRLVTVGPMAARLARVLSADSEPYVGGKVERAVLLAGPDATEGYQTLLGALGKDAALYVCANTNLAQAAGFRIAPYRTVSSRDGANLAKLSAFRDVGHSLTRWREPLDAWRGEAPAGWKSADGALFAESPDGRQIFDGVNPFQLCDRYRKTEGAQAVKTQPSGGWGIVPTSNDDLYLRSAAQSEENDLRRLAIVLGNLGVRAGRTLFARSVYLSPCPGGIENALRPVGHFNVLGPWPCSTDAKAELDAIYKVDPSVMGDTGETAEQMAKAGDVQPNPRFHPIGCPYKETLPPDLRFIDWRPTWHQEVSGVFSIDWMTAPAHFQPPCAWYAVAFLPRRFDGTASFRLEAPDAAKLWVNGKEVCRSTGNAPVGADGVPVYAMGHQGDGTFEGVNVVSVKVVSLKNPKMIRLRVSREPDAAARSRKSVPSLDKVDLYETANPDFDPYEYIYW